MKTIEQIAFRTFAPADTQALAELWHQAWHDAHGTLCPPEIVRHRTVASFARRVSGFGDDLVICEDDDGIAGFAALIGAEVDQFFLARRARGTGLAGRLMDRLERILRDRGVAEAHLECAVGNERARRFYRARGFVETGMDRRPVWMPDGTSAVFPMHRFAKRLGPCP